MSGCAIKRDRYQPPKLDLPAQFRHADAVTPGPALMLEAAPAEWWRLFGNHELDALMQRALAGSPDLRIASLRLMQVQARAGQARADELPRVTAPLRVTGEAPENGIATVPPGGEVRSERTIEASLRADWRVDLWGERRALSEVSQHRVLQAEFQRDDVRRRLLADVALQYAQYLSLNDRLQVARETDSVLQAILDAMAVRLEKGDATVIELAQQRAYVYAVRATLPGLHLQREEALQRLGALMGAVPGELHLSDQGLSALALPRIHPGVPGTLLLRRSDVRAAEADLLAADADIDVARARVLPSMDLSAQIGYGSRHLSQLFEPHTLFWEWVGNLTATIFDHGRRNLEVEFARAFHEELTAQYLRTVYQAVRETETALAALAMSERRIEAQREATRAAQEAWGFSQEAYAAGAIDYLTLLDTQRTHHQSLDAWHGTLIERHRTLIELFRALGAGAPADGAPGDRP